jgi:hypothetical protein
MAFGESALPTLKLPCLPHGEILRELAERNSMKGSFSGAAAQKPADLFSCNILSHKRMHQESTFGC